MDNKNFSITHHLQQRRAKCHYSTYSCFYVNGQGSQLKEIYHSETETAQWNVINLC